MRVLLTFLLVFCPLSINALEFKLVPANNAIYASGPIISGDAVSFFEMSSKLKNGTLFINSEGGSVTEAMALAETIKMQGYRVHVPDLCASACAAIVFPAGKTSTMSGHGVLGFHECYTRKGDQFKTDEPCNEMIRNYAVQNGFPYGTLSILARNKGATEMFWISRTLATCYGWHTSWAGDKPLMNNEAQPCVQAVIRTKTQNFTFGPSFDCEKATTDIENLICFDPDLTLVDAIMGNLYWTVFGDLSSDNKKVLRKSQRQWINTRNVECAPQINDINSYDKTRDAVHCMSVYIQKRMLFLSEVRLPQYD